MTAAMKANLSKNRFSQYAYKPEKKKIVPFGLEASAVPVLGEILNEDASLMESVTGLLAQARAGGTIISYENAVKKFKEFCAEKNYSYPEFTEKAVVHYIVQLDKDKASSCRMISCTSCFRSAWRLVLKTRFHQIQFY